MEVEAGAHKVSQVTIYAPYQIQKTKNYMDEISPQFKSVPDWQKWRLMKAFADLAATKLEPLSQIAQNEWRVRTMIVNRELKRESKGLPPDAVLTYRALLWDYLNKGEFSTDPVLEDKIRQHLRCWDEWSEASRKELNLMDRTMAWYWWIPIPFGAIPFFYAVFVLGKKTRQAYDYVEIAATQLNDHRKGKEPHEASVRAVKALMAYLKEKRK